MYVMASGVVSQWSTAKLALSWSRGGGGGGGGEPPRWDLYCLQQHRLLPGTYCRALTDGAASLLSCGSSHHENFTNTLMTRTGGSNKQGNNSSAIDSVRQTTGTGHQRQGPTSPPRALPVISNT